MSDVISRVNPQDLCVVIVLVTACVASLLIAIAACIVKIVQSNNQTKLKQEMLSRGMSAEEINMVLDAGRRPLNSRANS
jgi:hypothetical protein